MRKRLASEEGLRTAFRAKFVRLGKKINFKGISEETILLTEITDTTNNKVVADHLWFSFTKAFQAVILTPGAQIQFEARIKQYTKGYVNKKYGIDKRQKDFKLSHPTKVRLFLKGEQD